jgi:hypothetical protein
MAYSPVLIETSYPWEPKLPTTSLRAFHPRTELVEPTVIQRDFGKDSPVEKALLDKQLRQQQLAEQQATLESLANGGYHIDPITGKPILAASNFFHRIWPP